MRTFSRATKTYGKLAKREKTPFIKESKKRRQESIESTLETKDADAKNVAVETAFGNMFCVPLDFEMLSSGNPFFQYELKDRLSYELTFNSHGRVVVSTDTAASYEVTDIHLEFEVVNSPELAMMIRNKYNGQSKVMYDRVIRHSKESLDKSDTIWNIALAPRAKSMKGILMLFVDPTGNGGGANYARDSEKFYNPKIKKVSVTLDGVPNQLYSSGMLPHHQFEEIQKHFSEGRHRTAPHVASDLELADVELPEFLTTKFGLWLDMRSTDDPQLHGSGRKLEGASQSIQIEIEKEAETAGDLYAYVYYIQDAQLNIENGRLVNVVY